MPESEERKGEDTDLAAEGDVEEGMQEKQVEERSQAKSARKVQPAVGLKTQLGIPPLKRFVKSPRPH